MTDNQPTGRTGKKGSIERMRQRASDPFANVEDAENPAPTVDTTQPPAARTDDSMKDRFSTIAAEVSAPEPSVSVTPATAATQSAPEAGEDVLEILRDMGLETVSAPRKTWIRKAGGLAAVIGVLWAGGQKVAEHYDTPAKNAVTATVNGRAVKMDAWQVFYIIGNDAMKEAQRHPSGSHKREIARNTANALLDAMFENVHDREARVVIFANAAISAVIDARRTEAANLYAQGAKWSASSKDAASDWRMAGAMAELAMTLSGKAEEGSVEATNWQRRAAQWQRIGERNEITVRGEGWTSTTAREFAMAVREARMSVSKLPAADKAVAERVLGTAETRLAEATGEPAMTLAHK